MRDLTPRQVVARLDRYIVGQKEAKRAVAIALRNRWRRVQVEEPMRQDIVPNNILMIGPTGVGKTEIARRLAELCGAPLLRLKLQSLQRWATSGATLKASCATW